MFPNNTPIRAPEFDPMEVMCDEEFDRTIDAMQDAEQQILLNITSSLVDQMEIHAAEIVSGWCMDRILRVEAELTGDGTGEALPEFDAEERAGRPCGRGSDDSADGENYTPSLDELQDAADARGEPGPLDNKSPGPVTDWASGDMTPLRPESKEEIEAAHEQAKSDAAQADRLITDLVEFFFDPHEHKAVFDQMDQVDGWFGMAWWLKDAMLKEMGWTTDDLPGRGDSARPEPETEQESIAQSVRDAALAYNIQVVTANNASLKVTSRIFNHGLIDLMDIEIKAQLELKL